MMVFQVRLTPTKEEIVNGLKRAQLRRASKTRLILQTIVLITVAVWSLTAFFGGGMSETMSLMIGIAALVLIPVMWFVPTWQMNSMAQSIAESGSAPHMWVFEEGVDFGEEEPDYAYYPFGSFFCYPPKDEHDLQTLVMKFPGDDVVIVPKALLTDEQWQFLCDHTKEQPIKHGRR